MTTSIDLEAYETLELLGEGGMGSVHLVRHRPTGELRVAKVVHRRWQGEARFEARLEREAKLLARLRHAHIARLLEADLRPGRDAILIMEHIDGVGLDRVLRRLGRLSTGLAVSIARQLAGALAHLHGQGWIHRDISPDNVMIGWRDQAPAGAHATLIDLGIAKSLAGASVDLTATGGFVGKVRYSSPEQLTAGSELDPRSDLYSFGIVCYEMLTGRSPIEGESAESLVAGHLLHPPRPFADDDGEVPPALRELVMSMLAKRPTQRPPSAAAVLEVLERVSPGIERTEPGESKPSELDALRELVAGAREQTRLPPEDRATATLPLRLRRARQKRRQPWRRRVAIAAAAAILVAATLLFFLSRGEPEIGPAKDRPPAVEQPSESPSAASATSAADRETASRTADRGEQPPDDVAGPKPEEPAGDVPANEDESAASLARAQQGSRAQAGGTRGQDTLGAPASRRPSDDAARARLILDATPWAELVSIEDAEGTPLPLPEERTTPLAMSLHPGIYAVTLRHPQSRRPLKTTFELRPEATVRRHLELPSLTVDDFLHDLGW